MAKALAFGAAVVLVGLAGCSPFGSGAFVCQADEDCRQGGVGDGQCESTGYCSFANSGCEGGRRYGDHSGPLSNTCVGGGDNPDANPDIDAPSPEAGDLCLGTSTLVKPCFATAPSGTVVLNGNIDTDGAMCSTTVTNTTACVIAGAIIRAPTTVTATGSRPLVLVATDRIEVSGTLDVASHHAPGSPYATTQLGAGADPAACDPGTVGGANGGGAGGTFGAAGGAGGNAGGTAAAATAVTTLRGGCRGQIGVTGTPGDGGHGGGAVWLIAGTSITISGKLNASGEGGHPGVTGRAGGGGGGSGGLIGLDAPAIMNTGTVFANGASGGEGSGNSTEGNVGVEPIGAAAAPPPVGTSNGGVGGAGGAGGSAGGAATGGTGENAATYGGGGGGGGAGVIKVFGGTLGGARSPNPS